MIILYIIYSVVIYSMGFCIMFHCSARRDAVCRLEKDPLETFLVALFWPVVLVLLSALTVGDFICEFVCAVYDRIYESKENKHG